VYIKDVSSVVTKHHNHQELTEFMRRIASEYPLITRLESVGKSVRGRDLWAIEISDMPGVHEPGNSFLFALSISQEAAKELGI